MRGPGKATKKPVTIDYWHFHEDAADDPEDVARWCGGRVLNNLGHPSGKVAILVPTLEGEMTAQYDDYIIKGVQGEFYPCRPDIFAKTYHKVDS